MEGDDSPPQIKESREDVRACFSCHTVTPFCICHTL